MATSFPMANPWADNTLENAAALYNFITVPINDLAAQTSATGNGFIGEANPSGGVTLATAATYYALSATGVTFTLAAQRRVRIVTIAVWTMSSGTSARYFHRSACNTGTTIAIGSATYGPGVASAVTTITGSNGSMSSVSESTQLLTAGTYVAYAAGQRNVGGSATDNGNGFYIAVYDVGSV